MIFKIQKPLYSTRGNNYLIYNKDKSIMTESLQVGQIPEIDNMFGKEEKIYVKGYISKNRKDLVINRKVIGQDW